MKSNEWKAGEFDYFRNCEIYFLTTLKSVLSTVKIVKNIDHNGIFFGTENWYLAWCDDAIFCTL